MKAPIGKFTEQLLKDANPRAVAEDLEKNNFVQTIKHATDPDIVSWVGMARKEDPKGLMP